MKPRDVNSDDLTYWDDLSPDTMTFGPPDDMTDEQCGTITVVATDPGIDGYEGRAYRVPWELSDADIAAIDAGERTIWFTSLGHITAHQLEVAGSEPDPVEDTEAVI